MMVRITREIFVPTVDAMNRNGTPFKGILYAGLMMTSGGPRVLEFNVRFGDPETQPILMRLESDLVEAIEASIDGRTSDGDFKWSDDATVCVVMASGGYPGTFEAGKKIVGLEDAAKLEGVKIFHAGTSKRDGAFYTSGGRVLGVTARATELQTAVQRAYDTCTKIGFEGALYRKDIAARALKR
jgi:phosphoribosylamine--glycine ligase